jgi:hypothetical protein
MHSYRLGVAKDILIRARSIILVRFYVPSILLSTIFQYLPFFNITCFFSISAAAVSVFDGII